MPVAMAPDSIPKLRSRRNVVRVLAGERGLRAFEMKMAQTVRADDLTALLRFRADFPESKTHLLHLGRRRWHDRGIEVLPFLDCVSGLDHWL